MVWSYTDALALTDSFKQQSFVGREAVQVNWSQLHHEIALAALYTAYGAVLTCTSPLWVLWG